MHKASYYVAFVAFLNFGPSFAADYAAPIVEPRTAASEITKLLVDGRPNEASAALAKDLPPSPATQFSFDQIDAGFKLLTKYGGSDFSDEVLNSKHGQSVQIIIDYVHFPHADSPINQFLFLKYTFMKGGSGWVMTNFDFKTAAVFPPPGWTN